MISIHLQGFLETFAPIIKPLVSLECSMLLLSSENAVTDNSLGRDFLEQTPRQQPAAHVSDVCLTLHSLKPLHFIVGMLAEKKITTLPQMGGIDNNAFVL